jgi:hypothetical protein
MMSSVSSGGGGFDVSFGFGEAGLGGDKVDCTD